MEVAISTLVTALVSEYLPVESVAIKIAFGTLFSQLLEKIIYQSWFLRGLSTYFKRCSFFSKTKSHVFVTDDFTTRALTRHLRQIREQQQQRGKKDEIHAVWNLDHLNPHAGDNVDALFETFTIRIVRLATSKEQDGQHNHKADDREQPNAPPSDATYHLSCSAPIEVLPRFLRHVQSFMPNCLFLHREGFRMQSTLDKNGGGDDDGGRHRNRNDEQGLSSLFFDTLERYYVLQCNNIRCANLGYKGSDIILGAEPNTFAHSALQDKYQGQDLSISFQFDSKHQNRDANDDDDGSQNQRRVVCLRFESRTLTVTELKNYANYIFHRMGVLESESLLQKAISINEPEIQGHKETVARWRATSVTTTKTFQNTIVSDLVQKEFIDDVRHFVQSASTYVARGIPYCRGYVLHGPPGTGKSSLIRAVAREFGFKVFVANFSTMTCEHFNQLMSQMAFLTAGATHILAIEDVDRSTMFRKNRYGDDDDDNDNAEPKKPRHKRLTMEALLNALDGVAEAYGRITIFTGNDSKKFLSPTEKIRALLRPGRIDRMIEITFCSRGQMLRMFALHFPTAEPLDKTKIQKVDKLTPARLGETFMLVDQDTARCILYGEKPMPGLSSNLARSFLEPEDDDEKTNEESCDKKHNGENLDKSDTEDNSLLGASCRVPSRSTRFSKRKERAQRDKESEQAVCKSKPLTVRQIKNRQRKLRSKLREVNEVLAKGDAAAISWYNECKLWMARFTQEESEYQKMIDNFAAAKSTTTNKLLENVTPDMLPKPRGRPKKVRIDGEQPIAKEKEEKKEKPTCTDEVLESQIAMASQHVQHLKATCAAQDEVKRAVLEFRLLTKRKQKQKRTRQRNLEETFAPPTVDDANEIKHHAADSDQIHRAPENDGSNGAQAPENGSNGAHAPDNNGSNGVHAPENDEPGNNQPGGDDEQDNENRGGEGSEKSGTE